MRIDSGYREGDRVTPYYDPLVAKIIARGQDRAAAIAHAVDALKSTQVEGIRTNREFLVACLEDSVFAAGGATTRFIDERGGQLFEAARLAARRP